MSLTRQFRKDPAQGLKMYSQFFVPLRNFLEQKIKDLELKVDINELYPMEEVWEFYCDDEIRCLSRRLNRMKRKEAFDGHIKRPTTSFFQFIQDKRPEIMKRDPKPNITEVTKIASEMWNKLSDSDRKKYEDLYKKDKERYNKEREEAYEKAKEEGRLHDELKPKRSLSAFMFFFKDKDFKESETENYNKAISKGEVTNWMGYIKTKWDNMSDKDKSKYNKLAEEDHKRYEKELEEYNEKFKNYTEEELPENL